MESNEINDIECEEECGNEESKRLERSKHESPPSSRLTLRKVLDEDYSTFAESRDGILLPWRNNNYTGYESSTFSDESVSTSNPIWDRTPLIIPSHGEPECQSITEAANIVSSERCDPFVKEDSHLGNESKEYVNSKVRVKGNGVNHQFASKHVKEIKEDRELECQSITEGKGFWSQMLS